MAIWAVATQVQEMQFPNSLGILAGSVGGPLSDQVNANYTDGTTSMSLAQWAIENTVSQTSDTEAVVIDRSSGADEACSEGMKMAEYVHHGFHSSLDSETKSNY